MLFKCAHSFCKKQTDSFSVLRIEGHLPLNPQWAIAPLEEDAIAEVRKITSQPFTYLGKGAQVFVFASKDDRYVLKLIRHHHISPPSWFRALPFERAQLRCKRLYEKGNQDFISYALAYKKLKKETGILYPHLEKTAYLNQKITIVDKLGIKHILDLDEIDFILQKKAELAGPKIKALLAEKKYEESKQLISSLIALIVSRNKKEIFDKDPNVFTNFGVLEGEVIQIDVGRFSQNEHQKELKNIHNDVVQITDRLSKKLFYNDKEMELYLQEQIEQIDATPL